MIAALALSLLLAEPQQPPQERTSFPRVLAWVGAPKGLDLITTERALRLGATEGNPFVPTLERRVGMALVVVPLAAWAFYECEKKPGWLRRLPRYLWALGHLAIGAVNVWRTK